MTESRDEDDDAGEVDSPVAESAPLKIHGFRLLEKVGEGGFGAIYKAEQREPIKRTVAVKVIKLGMDTEQVIARFEAERQALALMDHPHIAQVFEAGATEQGRPFFVMEFVHGLAITDYCRKHALSVGDRLALFMDVCEAVQHAHQKGVIHRDLKPSNILVTRQGDAHVPKVIDFGIAKATLVSLTDRTLHTRFDQFVGTPSYMSPEQADMAGMDVDTRSDVYSLGALLYELLTGTPPFDPKDLAKHGESEMRRIICDDYPPKPSTQAGNAPAMSLDPAKLGKRLQGDLDAIVMKALEKDRSRRYSSASALAEDIDRHVRHEPITASTPSVLYQWRKTVKRHRSAFVTAGLVMTAIVIGALAAVWQARRAEASKEAAESALAINEALRVRREHEIYAASIQLANAKIGLGKTGEAAALLWKQPVEMRSWEWGYTMAQMPVTELWSSNAKGGAFLLEDWLEARERAAEPGVGVDAGYHRDFLKLAFANDYENALSADERYFAHLTVPDTRGQRMLKIWDVRSNKLLHEAKVDCDDNPEMVWAPDGIVLILRHQDVAKACRIEVGTWRTTKVVEIDPIRAWNPSSLLEQGLLLPFPGASLRVLDPQTLDITKHYEFEGYDRVAYPYVSHQRDWVVAAAHNDVLMQGSDGAFTVLYKHPAPIKAFAALDADRLVVAGARRFAIIGKDGKVEREWGIPADLNSMGLLREGQLGVIDRSGHWRIYDVGKEGMGSRHLLEVPVGAECRKVFFAPSGRQLGFMKWDTKATHVIEARADWDQPVTTLPVAADSPSAIRVANDVPGFHSRTGELVSRDAQGLQFYALRDGAAELTRSLKVESHANQFRFDSQRNRVLSVPGSARIDAIDMSTGEVTEHPLSTAVLESGFPSLDMSPDASNVVVGRYHQLPHMTPRGEWFLLNADLELLSHHVSQNERVTVVVFHPGGQFLAIGFRSGAVEIWDLHKDERYIRFHRDPDVVSDVFALAFGGHDGERLFVLGRDRTMQVWDWRHGVEVLTLETTSSWLTSVAISQDRLAVAHGGFDPGLVVRFALPWWYEQGDPRFYESLRRPDPAPRSF